VKLLCLEKKNQRAKHRIQKKKSEGVMHRVLGKGLQHVGGGECRWAEKKNTRQLWHSEGESFFGKRGVETEAQTVMNRERGNGKKKSKPCHGRTAKGKDPSRETEYRKHASPKGGGLSGVKVTKNQKSQRTEQ